MMILNTEQVFDNIGSGLLRNILSVSRCKAVEVKSFFCTEGNGDAVVIVGILINEFTFTGNLVSLDGFHILMDVCHVPATACEVITMGSGTDTDIGYVTPIVTVMTGTESRLGEIADLVVFIACGSQFVDEQFDCI